MEAEDTETSNDLLGSCWWSTALLGLEARTLDLVQWSAMHTMGPRGRNTSPAIHRSLARQGREPSRPEVKQQGGEGTVGHCRHLPHLWLTVATWEPRICDSPDYSNFLKKKKMPGNPELIGNSQILKLCIYQANTHLQSKSGLWPSVDSSCSRDIRLIRNAVEAYHSREYSGPCTPHSGGSLSPRRIGEICRFHPSNPNIYTSLSLAELNFKPCSFLHVFFQFRWEKYQCDIFKRICIII